MRVCRLVTDRQMDGQTDRQTDRQTDLAKALWVGGAAVHQGLCDD